MKVKELREALEGLPDDMECIVQKDSEGNGYSPLHDVDPDAVYIPEATWYGEVYSANWTAEDACVDEEDWEELLSKPRALIFCPVN